VGTLLKRELTSMGLLAQTYAIAVAFIIISGVFFIDLVSNSQTADLAAYYANIANTLIVLCPILAARSLAEERASGQLMISLAWPVPRWALVLSKFIANTLYTWLLISIAWIYYIQLNSFANPDFARTLGGYIGLLLLAAMFNALTLAVSARAATPASGAFLGFGLLLFLWVAQYLPDSVKSTFDRFAPMAHLDPMLRGIIYFADVAYFVVLSAGALGLTMWALSRRQSGTDRQVLVRRLVATGAVFGLFFATPSIASAATGQIDLTPEKRETVSDTTREIIKKIGDMPIVLTSFSQAVSGEASQVRTTVRKYKAAGANIKARIIDPDISPGLAAASGITDYNTYLIQVGDKKPVEIDDIVESTVTSTIALMSQEKPPNACFISGHGERKHDEFGEQDMSSFSARLLDIGYHSERVILKAEGGMDLLKECRVVLLMGPRSNMDPEEIKILREYAQEKGRLVVVGDAVRGDVDQLNQIIEPWGLRFYKGAVRDPQSLADDPAAVVSSRYPTANSIVDIIHHDDSPVVFSNTLAIENLIPDNADEGPQISVLVESSPQSYLIDPKTEKRLSKDAQPYAIAAITDDREISGSGTDSKLSSTRIGVVGSADMASNRYQKTAANQEFFIRLVQKVAQDDELISAYREIGQNATFTITGDQRRTLIRQTVVLPGLAALVFVPFVLWRLKRG
jgi:ABC-type transport system involved in multi-copper enzyme maturation permease subunit